MIYLQVEQFVEEQLPQELTPDEGINLSPDANPHNDIFLFMFSPLHFGQFILLLLDNNKYSNSSLQSWHSYS